ncbi:putative ribonuclease H-like domain-containing protein [Tanacetum coccineum]
MIDADDLEEMDLKWQMALLTMRARRFLNKTGRKINANGSEIIRFNKSKVECYNCHKKGHFARDFRALRENMNREPIRRNMIVDTMETKALISDSEDENETEFKSKKRKPSFAKTEFVKSNEHVKTPRESVKKVENKKQAKYPRKNSQSPRAVLMKSGIKTLNTAGQNFSKAAVSVNTARPINTAYPRPTVNSARIASNVFNRAHTHVRRPFNKSTTNKNNNLKEKVNTVKGNVTTAGPKAVGNPQLEFQEKVVIDSGCSRHMTGNKSYLSDYKEIDVGFVAFGGDPKGIENQINHKFYGMRGIKREFSVARTPQQNKTLIEAARTMLADSLLPTTFWAKAVNTACYVQNRVLVTKPHNKTPYELLLGKFDGKADEGFLVGYSINSKAFRVFNSKTMKVEENLHINFLENKPNVAGSGPEWLFDIDSLTKSMMYEPFTAGNQTNGDAGIETNVNAGQAGQEKASDHEYILLPVMLSNSLLSSKKKRGASNKEDDQHVQDLRYELNSLLVQQKEGYANSTNRDSTASPSVSTVGLSINIASENINTGSPNINTASLILDDSSMQSLENTGIFDDAYDDRGVGVEADLNNLETIMNVSPIPTTRIHKDHLIDQIIGDINSATQTRRMTKISEEHAMLDRSNARGASNKEDDQHVQDFRAELDNLLVQQKEGYANSTNRDSTASPSVSTAGPSINTASENINTGSPNINTASPIPNDSSMQSLENTGIFDDAYDDREVGAEADLNNLETTMNVSPIPTTRIHKDHPKDQIIGDINSATQTRRMTKISEEHAMVSYIKKQRRTNHKDYQNCLFAYFLSQIEPKKVIQALTDPSWIEAMQEELLQFKLQKVWTLVDLPKGKRAIGTKWVYRNKKDERGIVVRNKARLVAQGYTQEEGIDYDEVFAHVARIEAIRLFFAYASFMGLIVNQMDVKSAFLYGTIEKEVYVCQPPGFKDPQFSDKVYKVEKTLYGLHQAPRAWYETLSTYLLENGYRRGTIDKTLFIKKDKGDILIVQVQQKEDGIFISQDKYVADILKKFDFITVKKTSTPMEPNKVLVKDEEADNVDVLLYRSMIGSLMYKTASMPDITFAVCACARFQVTPKVSCLHAVKRIFRYLKGQPKLGLWYLRDSPFDLEAFFDSDYASASLDRKSTIGAEYVAAANCCGQSRMDGRTCNIKQKYVKNQIPKRGQDTKIPQSGGSPKKVGDKAAHKELGDRMERVATIASSLEADHESERSTSPSESPSPHPLVLHHSQLPTSPPSMQTNYVVEEAATMPHDSPLLRVHLLRSDEGSMTLHELTVLYSTLSKKVEFGI